MNNKLYNNLIFELSNPGCVGYSLPRNEFPHHEISESHLRNKECDLPECDELTVVRHYTNNSGNNFGVDNGFYPLGSCTMKYNPKINDEIAGMKEFTDIHPLQPETTTLGCQAVTDELRSVLSQITGMDDFTLKPCAGAHGELTGLMIIRAYHESRNDTKRTKVIIPDSAHGTNPASAAVCGLDVVEVKSMPDGTVDVEDLATKLDDTVAAMMMTNPNTLGIFEHDILKIVDMVHKCEGLMYYDGANFNPLLGACRPGDMGFDVLHLNLHKTFSTPHGGGGPGSGPVGVRKGLSQFFPLVNPYHGNFLVELRGLAYVLSLGKENIKNVGPLATLNASYIKESLKDIFELPIEGLCKHEFVFNGLLDKSTGVTTMDVAKRLLDYGFHAPTIYFPLLFHESMMIEPTEGESKDTLDAFIETMRIIAEEAKEKPEVVKSAPHNTPISRVDDVLAARQLVLVYPNEKKD